RLQRPPLGPRPRPVVRPGDAAGRAAPAVSARLRQSLPRRRPAVGLPQPAVAARDVGEGQSAGRGTTSCRAGSGPEAVVWGTVNAESEGEGVGSDITGEFPWVCQERDVPTAPRRSAVAPP